MPPTIARLPIHLRGPFHKRTAIGIVGSRGRSIELRPLAEGEHRHDGCSSHARRIVDRCLCEPVGVELLDPLIGDLEHRVLRAELQAARGAGLDARGLKTHRHAIDAHRALVHALGLRVELGNVEGASGHAVPAADALVLLKVDNAVGVLHDGPGRGARGEAPGLGAVHALVLAHQPVERAVLLVLPELDQVPEVRRHVGQRLVRPHLHRGFRRQIVPLLTGDLAGLAADARRRVDELRDRRHRTDSGCGGRRGGDAKQFEGGCWHCARSAQL